MKKQCINNVNSNLMQQSIINVQCLQLSFYAMLAVFFKSFKLFLKWKKLKNHYQF
jgi:hypothetical protein